MSEMTKVEQAKSALFQQGYDEALAQSIDALILAVRAEEQAKRETLVTALRDLIFPMEAWNEAIERVTGEQPVVNDALITARAALAGEPQ